MNAVKFVTVPVPPHLRKQLYRFCNMRTGVCYSDARETCPCATCNLTRFYDSQAAR